MLQHQEDNSITKQKKNGGTQQLKKTSTHPCVWRKGEEGEIAVRSAVERKKERE